MDTYRLFFDWVGVFFICYLIGYSTILFVSVVAGSSVLYRRKRQERLKNMLMRDSYIPITIIVPAYNEEVTVVDTVRSLISLDYKLFEIIVVDDGSKDDTSKKLIEAFSLHRIHRPIKKEVECQPAQSIYENVIDSVQLTLIRKKNGGKADALNMGINASRFPYFICIDADSVLQNDSLKRIMRPVLEDSSIVAVGGVVRPSNGVEIKDGRVIKYTLPKNILACMQVLEYDRSFLASRILFDLLKGSLIISGAFGLFRKETVIKAGGYDTKTIGEDMELVVKLHHFCVVNGIPYSVGYATDAVCWTQVPERFKDLRSQRRRWHIGLCQSMFKHRAMFANPKFGAASIISYTYFLLYELLSPYIEIFGVITVIIAFFIELINVPFMISFFLLYALYNSVLSLTAFFARTQTTDLKLSFTDVVKAILLCFIEVSFLRFLLSFVRLTAFSGYKKKKLNWGKIERRKIDYK